MIPILLDDKVEKDISKLKKENSKLANKIFALIFDITKAA